MFNKVRIIKECDIEILAYNHKKVYNVRIIRKITHVIYAHNQKIEFAYAYNLDIL